ncbi:hypothetical protein RRG08_061002 [Elysia crispata]|uniref:Uncharacterized protein n=1 Tax=Elysia crispata TaxID=231223 RepID=A0AAE1AUU4_9GAST|nr:hypothetical protein RRG08_061002 [Elysia crispata]
MISRLTIISARSPIITQQPMGENCDIKPGRVPGTAYLWSSPVTFDSVAPVISGPGRQLGQFDQRLSVKIKIRAPRTTTPPPPSPSGSGHLGLNTYLKSLTASRTSLWSISAQLPGSWQGDKAGQVIYTSLTRPLLTG